MQTIFMSAPVFTVFRLYVRHEFSQVDVNVGVLRSDAELFSDDTVDLVIAARTEDIPYVLSLVAHAIETAVSYLPGAQLERTETVRHGRMPDGKHQAE